MKRSRGVKASSTQSSSRAKALQSITTWTEEQIESVAEEPPKAENTGETMESKIERVNRRKR